MSECLDPSRRLSLASARDLAVDAEVPAEDAEDSMALLAVDSTVLVVADSMALAAVDSMVSPEEELLAVDAEDAMARPLRRLLVEDAEVPAVDAVDSMALAEDAVAPSCPAELPLPTSTSLTSRLSPLCRPSKFVSDSTRTKTQNQAVLQHQTCK